MFTEQSKIPFYQKILHVFLLSGFLFAQPLLNLIGANVEFLVARNVGWVEVYILLFALCILIPSAITIIELITRLLGQRVANAAHIIILFVLSSSLFTLTLNNVSEMPAVMLVTIAIAMGIISCYVYVKYSIIRTYLNFLSPAIIVFPIFFLLNPQVSKITSSRQVQESTGITSSTLAPVVMVVFDELPTLSLLDENGQIDSVRYPNFSSLASDAIWYRDATTVSGSTTKSIPAILSGLRPENELLPIEKDYPHTLFTLLKDSHEFEVFETATSLCPDLSCGGDIIVPSLGSLRTMLTGLFSDISIIYLHLLLPEDFTGSLPVITQTWKDFQENVHDENTESKRREHWNVTRPEGFANFVNKITFSETSRFYFIHSMLPHVPWTYLPSGKEYLVTYAYSVPGLNIKKEEWGDNDWLVTQGYQRHLLQVGFIDKLLGDLLSRLKEQALYEQSLIIVTSDHGVSFWPDSSRRGITDPENRRDLLGIPLFMKLPNQKEGSINDDAIRSIDIFPTLAHILGVEIPWEVDGKNILLSPSIQGNKPDAKNPYADSKSLKRKIELFGSGKQDAKGLYRIGSHRELIGTETNGLIIDDNSDVSVSVDQREDLSAVDFSNTFIPAHITGDILKATRNSEPINLALSVNGTIAAVTSSYTLKGGHRYAAIIPASSLKEGNNTVDVLAIKENEGIPSLSKLAVNNSSGTSMLRILEENSDRDAIELAHVYDFSDDTQARLFYGSGWSHASSNGGRWNATDEASLVFAVKSDEFPLELAVQSVPYFVQGSRELQVIQAVLLSGTKQEISLQKGETDGRFVILIAPKDIGPNGTVVIKIKFPNAVSPNSLGKNADPRLLAIKIKTIQVLTSKVISN